LRSLPALNEPGTALSRAVERDSDGSPGGLAANGQHDCGPGVELAQNTDGKRSARPMFLQATGRMNSGPVKYTQRQHRSAWPPDCTLKERVGSLPDWRGLMIESLPLRRAAARFVSGYHWWKPKPDSLRTLHDLGRGVTCSRVWAGGVLRSQRQMGPSTIAHKPLATSSKSTLPPRLRPSFSGPWVVESEPDWG